MKNTNRQTKGILTATVILFACIFTACQAVPTDAQLGDLKAKLDKKIRVQFLDTPLSLAIELLQKESGVTFLLERDPSDDLGSQTVTIEAKQMSIRQALNWACRAAGADWEVSRDVIVVADRNTIVRRQLASKVYDIRSLIVHAPNFVGPALSIDGSLSNTSSGGSAGSGVAMAATSLFGDEVEEEYSMSREEAIEQITGVIRDTAGDMDDWAAHGGELFSLRELNGNLIVRATPTVHAEITKLLGDLYAATGRLVSIDARHMSIKSKLLNEVVAANGGYLVFDKAQADALMQRLAQPNAGAERLAVGRTICMNEQRVTVVAVSERTYLSDIEPIPGSLGVDPTISTSRPGVVLDVQPTISYGDKTVKFTLRGDVVTHYEIKTSRIPVGGRDVTAPAKADNDALAPAQPRLASAELEKPSQNIVRHRTSIEIPNGGAVIMTGTANNLKIDDAENTEVVVILRARFDPRRGAVKR